MFGSQVQDDVLELLVNAPSSFAALFGYLSRGATTRINVADLAAVLTEFEKRGWVRLCLLSGNGAFRPVTKEDLHRAIAEYSAWLDHATDSGIGVDELSLDEVGVWVELLPAGRKEWEQRSAPAPTSKGWVLDQDAAAGTVTINAKDVGSAERALLDWQRRQRGISVLPGSRVVEPIPPSSSTDGGVRLTVRYVIEQE